MSVYMYINTRTYNRTLKWNIFWMMFSDTQSNKSTVDKLHQISKNKDSPSKQYLQMYNNKCIYKCIITTCETHSSLHPPLNPVQ